jgi:hypothetical protein
VPFKNHKDQGCHLVHFQCSRKYRVRERYLNNKIVIKYQVILKTIDNINLVQIVLKNYL